MLWKPALTAAAVAAMLVLAPAGAQGQDKPVESNPYTGKAEAVAEGKKLYMKWGCFGCHGMEGDGGAGPSLIDADWIYGETDAEVFRSIHDGRPDGMPNFGEKLSREEILKVMAYIRSNYQATRK